MSLVVDVSNVLHAAAGPAGGGWDLDPVRMAAIVAQGRYGDRRAVLVCDGAGRQDAAARHLRIGRVEILHAGPAVEADTIIERLIAVETAPRRLVVVSSDRRIIAAARRRRSTACSSEQFVRELRADEARRAAADRRPASPREAVPLPPSAVAAWIDRLGLAGDPLLTVPRSADARVDHPQAPAPRSPAPKHPARHPSQQPAQQPAKQQPRRDDRHDAQRVRAAAGAAEAALIAEIVRASGGAVTPEDLDMSRWLGEDPRNVARRRGPS